MVSIIKKIIPIAIAGLGIFALANIVARPKMAQDSATALSSTLSGFGTGIGQVGTGIGSALGSIGSGSARLLDPLFSLKTLVYGENAQSLTPSESASVTIRQQEQQLTASNTLINDPVVNTASDQPGVTPQSPASETAVPQVSTARFPSARRATSSERSTLSDLTGGLLG
tara:strand:+ start:473 stop:982 length:510 start_codon:yes stop_codon:yes gene_type:complete